jgi:hypothetical protein
MANSAVSIANLALSLVGRGNAIESLTESSKEAKIMEPWYNIVRQEALKAYNWTFAEEEISMAVHSEDTTDEWGYRYQFPSAALQIREIVNPVGRRSTAVPYQIRRATDGTKCILTNVEDAKVRYTIDEDDPSVYPSDFITGLAHLWASRVAYQITGKRTVAQDMLQGASAFLQIAATNNANEEIEDAPRDAEWIAVRGSAVEPVDRIDRS